MRYDVDGAARRNNPSKKIKSVEVIGNINDRNSGVFIAA